MRIIGILILTGRVALAQDAQAPPSEAAAPPALAVPVVTVPSVAIDFPPLAPADPNSPYASPRDAARHRFQATLAELESARNVKAGIQGFAEAFALDRTYAPAAFNLAVLAAIGGKSEDALSAFEEAARLDPALGKSAVPQIERLRLIRSLEASPEGKRRRNYDDALYPLLRQLPKLRAADAIRAVADVGKIDPKRWEAPALLAGLNGDGRGYDVAARFLEIATSNATLSAIKEKLQKALEAAQRELHYAAARAAADTAADRGEYDKAGDLYEKTWAVMPARAFNGMEAASAWLLHDDTVHAAALLARLREGRDTELAGSAAAMLKELEPIEPAAKAPAADAGDFFRDSGSADPVYISDLIPPIDQSEMELLARPLPRLVSDAEPVVLLSALAANPADAPSSAGLPPLSPPRIAGEHPWRELSQISNGLVAGAADPVLVDAATPPDRGSVIVETPNPAPLFVNGMAIAAQAPVELIFTPGVYRIGAEFPSGRREREVAVKPGAHLRLQLRPSGTGTASPESLRPAAGQN